MDRFFRNVIGPDEKLILLARLHWIYVLSGFFWMAGLALFGGWLDSLLWRYFGVSTPFAGQEIMGIRFGARVPMLLVLFGGCGAMIFCLYVVKFLATEIALTGQRVIYKTGLIFVDVEEIDLVEIRAEKVDHGMLGRFLGYGSLRLDSRFVGDIRLPALKNPYRLIKAMHRARAEHVDTLDGEIHHRHRPADPEDEV